VSAIVSDDRLAGANQLFQLRWRFLHRGQRFLEKFSIHGIGTQQGIGTLGPHLLEQPTGSCEHHVRRVQHLSMGASQLVWIVMEDAQIVDILVDHSRVGEAV
jgi:hypothetical protein